MFSNKNSGTSNYATIKLTKKQNVTFNKSKMWRKPSTPSYSKSRIFFSVVIVFITDISSHANLLNLK